MKNTFLFIATMLLCISKAWTNPASQSSLPDNPFLGTWVLDIEGGGVGWLHVHDQQGFLDAELLWIGGSVVPVSDVYLANESTLVVTRTNEVTKTEEGTADERKHIRTHTLRIKKSGEQLQGTMTGPSWGRKGETTQNFTGRRMPPIPNRPHLSDAEYGKPIPLFNGKNLDGWRLVDPKHKNGFKVTNGELVNEPVQPESGEHVNYGNLRTDQEFEDFNLKLEVNVPEGNNSGVYLRGMYEIQVVDSYGKAADSHNMGALYSRIVPDMTAEKPAGEWQTLDITLYDRYLTVILNGEKIIDNEPVRGPTGGAISSDVLDPGPIILQGDHGNVAYRDIVLTPIL